MKKILISALFALGFFAQANAQSVYIEEDPTFIRFEQYTGATGNINFWRLPTPGASTFPNTTCTSVIIPSDKSEHSSRFLALYLFAKNSNKKVFYFINPSNCQIVSFGMNG